MEVVARALWVAACLAVSVLVLGLWFNTDPDPDVFGKYSTETFLKLGLVSVMGYLACLLLRVLFLPTRFVVDGQERVIPYRRKWWITISLASVAFLAIEGTLRWKSHRARPTVLEHRTRNAPRFHPFLQAVPIPNDGRLHINRWGFRGDDIARSKPPCTLRIFVVGGSTVFCDRTDFEHSHPRLLEKRLREIYPNVSIEVQNAGMHWHTSQHSLIKILFKIRDFNPDIIIVFHAVNDLYRGFPSEEFGPFPYQSDYSHYHGPIAHLFSEYFHAKPEPLSLAGERVRDFVKRRWFRDFREGPTRESRSDTPDSPTIEEHRLPDGSDEAVTEWPSLPAFERNMEYLSSFVTRMNVDLIMASQPYLYREDHSEEESAALVLRDRLCRIGDARVDVASMIRGMDAFNDASMRAAALHGVRFVDLEAVVPKSLDYFLDDVHYTEEGNRVVAERLAEEIVAGGYIAMKGPRGGRNRVRLRRLGLKRVL